MEAILLAGGFGTRIRPLTYTRPKPLLPVANRTLIEHALDTLPPKFDTVILPVNYLAHKVRKHFEENPDPRLVFVDEKEPLGSGGAIKNCEKYITGPFLVYNADIVSTLDANAFVAAHEGRRAGATISLWPVDEPWHFGVVELDGDGRIRKFVEKPPQGTEPSRLINAGHYMLDPTLLDRIPKNTPMSLEREVFQPYAAEGGPIYGHSIQGYWIDCGRPESYLEAHRLVLNHRGIPHVKGRNGTQQSGRFQGYALGHHVELQDDAHVERSVLLDGVRLERGAHVADSILGEGVTVGKGSRLERCVVADGATIAPGTHLLAQRVGMRPGDA